MVVNDGDHSDPRLVSLIMPVWQANGEWLQLAVRSCLAQTHSNVELIVVDDGCAEPVASLLPDFDDPRLRIMRISHAGVSNGRNAGVAAARGSWIRFVDADDVLPPASTTMLLQSASRSFPVVYGQTKVCDEQLRPLRTMTCRREGEVLVPGITGELDIMLQAMLFDRAVVASAGGFNPALELMEDHDFVLRATAHVQVRSVDEIVYLYRQHSRSACNQATLERSVECWTYVKGRFFQRHPELVDRVKRRVEAVIDLQRARALAARGEVRPALKIVLRTLPAAPRKAALTGASILRQALGPSRWGNNAKPIGSSPGKAVSRSTTP